MAEVLSDSVKSWLVNVLQEYADPRTTYSHVARVLSTLPSLKTRTDNFTHENGQVELLLVISGSLPVVFRGQEFRYPVTVWIPRSYPRSAPFVFVNQAPNTARRPSHHVDNTGRVSHFYLAQWQNSWNTSSIEDLLANIRNVFASDPPLVLSPQHSQPPVLLPPKQRLALMDYSMSTVNSSAPTTPDLLVRPSPPARPPKQAATNLSNTLPTPGPSNFNGPPQRPPALPVKLRPHPQRPQIPHSSPYVGMGAASPSYASMHGNQYVPSPVPQSHVYGPTASVSGPTATRPHVDYAHAASRTAYQQSQPSLVTARNPFQMPAMTPGYAPPSSARPVVVAPRPNIDLLTSVLDSDQQPSTHKAQAHLAPPVPLNPLKGSLLKSLSDSLVAESNRVLEENKAAFHSLQGQQRALAHAHAKLQHEIEQMQGLNSLIDTNEKLLGNAIQEADMVMHEAAGRPRPNADDILISPTRVGDQLYHLVAQNHASQSVRQVLTRALDRKKVSIDVFIKQSRNLAREEFARKLLIKKIAAGMNLAKEGHVREMHDYYDI